jgi:hypothetical protein
MDIYKSIDYPSRTITGLGQPRLVAPSILPRYTNPLGYGIPCLYYNID